MNDRPLLIEDVHLVWARIDPETGDSRVLTLDECEELGLDGSGRFVRYDPPTHSG